jgi:potassium/chloride transporter 4/5/6
MAEDNGTELINKNESGVEWSGARSGKEGTDLDDKMAGLSRRFDFKEGGDVKLGTMMGVYIPTLQNILGIILFIRLPWITGQGGIVQALVIVLLGCSASMLTSLSMSAICTNGVPKGGGAFSVIKESIGPEFGGTVGCLLFLSNTFGLAMYVLGCVEILQGWIAPFEDVNVRVLGAIVLGILFVVVFIGISYISKASMLFMAGVMLAIFSIYAGVIEHAIDPNKDAGIVGLSSGHVSDNIGPKYEKGYSFGVMLAIFFPAVTDPLAGSNLSGDLQDPQGSIPIGTILAVLTTTVIFCLQVILVGGSVDRETLIEDQLILTTLAWPVKEIIYIGMLMSTLGAGLQSLAGAPRLLAAIGRDGLIPEFAIFNPPPGSEPRAAVAFCAFLSCCAVMLGSLDAVAPFITMWFLTCYGIINGACAFLAYEKIPSFRPTFKYYNWKLSLFGAFQCFGMMFYCAPTWYYAVLACSIAIGIYFYVQRQLGLQASGHKQPLCCGLIKAPANDEDPEDAQNTDEGDWRSGHRFMAARESLLQLKPGDMDFKYWRPFILFLAKTSMEDGAYVPQGGMIHLIQQLMKRGKGLAIVGGVIEGTFEEKHELAETAMLKLHGALAERGIEGFPEIICAPSVYEGYKTLVTAKGLGSLRPNTVMLGWPTDVGKMKPEDEDSYASLCSYIATAKKTLLICKGSEMFPAASGQVGSGANAGVVEVMTGHIDVWWIFDLFPSNGLMLLLPYLLQKHKIWKKCHTRLFAVAAPTTDLGKLKKLLETMIASGGIVVKVEVMHMDPDEAPRFQSGTTVRRVSKSQLLDVNIPPQEGVEVEHQEDGGSASGGGITALLAKKSANSPLVVLTLPKQRKNQSAGAWLKSTEGLVAPLKRCIFVQESGHERIQFSSDQ